MCTWSISIFGLEQEDDADDHEEDLGRQVQQREDDVEARRLLDAHDVEGHRAR